jgi:hypothetical protein
MAKILAARAARPCRHGALRAVEFARNLHATVNSSHEMRRKH